jgi:hypothetical protein
MDLDDYDGYEDLQGCNYGYWLKHDLVTIVQISCIATGHEPIEPRNFFNHKSDYKKQHEIFELLLNALEANKIKANSQDCWAKAHPLDWLGYLKNKNYPLPIPLDDILIDELLENAPHNQNGSLKRSKESYQNKEGRDDLKALQAILRTLLDLYPILPKSELITLRPVTHYANGAAHSEASLLKMISEIEGKNRGPGRIPTEQVEKIKRDIPKNWLPSSKKA